MKQLLKFGLVTLLLAAVNAVAASKEEIDIKVEGALKEFKLKTEGADKYLEAAEGVLVFPSVVKAGFGIGGQYGEGALLIDGATVDYYSTAGASFGFQIGAQSKTVIIMFMTEPALKGFRESKGWEAGVDGSVALVQLGAGGSLDTTNIKDPVVGFVFGNKGLMYNLTLEGSKFTKLDK